MDIKQQAITEYLTKGTGYRQLAKKYAVSWSTINKWVQIHQVFTIFAPQQYNRNTSNRYLQQSNARIGTHSESLLIHGISLEKLP